MSEWDQLNQQIVTAGKCGFLNCCLISTSFVRLQFKGGESLETLFNFRHLLFQDTRYLGVFFTEKFFEAIKRLVVCYLRYVSFYHKLYTEKRIQ